jgi:hypothetical protein
VSIRDDIPGKIPVHSAAAMTAGLAKMGSPDLDVIVTQTFVKAVREVTGEADYHVDRNGGRVAARTVHAEGCGPIVVANWEVLVDLTDFEVERVLAHEAGHASIESSDESPWARVDAHFADHWWNRQLAYGAAVAIDEFRCEAAVYAAGYPTGPGLADEDVADDLFGLYVQLLGADYEYQSHLDVERLRDDVLKTVVFHVRYMGKIAARYLHGVPVELSGINRFARANWEAFVEPTWDQFLDVYRTVPNAMIRWPGTAPTEAAIALVGVVASQMTSFGYEATEDSFWIRMSADDRQVRLDRANAEADLLGLNT